MKAILKITVEKEITPLDREFLLQMIFDGDYTAVNEFFASGTEGKYEILYQRGTDENNL